MNDNWMELFLDQNGFLVSGTKSLALRFGLTGETRPSLRFVAWSHVSSPKAIFFLVVERIHPSKALKVADKLENHPIYTALENLLQPMHLLLTLNDGRFFLGAHMTPDELARWFYQIEPALLQHIGTSKETNRRESQRKGDLFRTFTRKHLSRFCISNDIDALRLPQAKSQRPLLLELKKPNAPIERWKPYIDDCANYMYLQTIAQQRNIDFRVIAYNLNQTNRVQLILNAICDQPNRLATRIDYEAILVNPHNAIGSIPQPLKPKRSYRRRQIT